MTRLIDADAFRKWLCALFAGSGTHEDDTKEEEEWNASLARIITHLDEAPTVEERPHGEWIENTRYKRKGKKFLDCSRCHYGENGDIICEVSKLPNFCPNCGADMRKREGEKNESDHL